MAVGLLNKYRFIYSIIPSALLYVILATLYVIPALGEESKKTLFVILNLFQDLLKKDAESSSA
jgi:hypothetical protein